MRTQTSIRNLCLGLTLIVVAQAHAEDQPMTVITTVKWDELKEAGKLKTGEVIPSENGQAARLKIVNKTAGSLPLCEIDRPAIKTPSYAIRGKIKYQNVVGVGFLEMWNHFGKQGQYFTRTMDASGPMGMVTGTSAEREFILPFHTMGQAPAPDKLVVNLVLNGSGEVEISSLELVPIDAMGGGWWSGQTAGLIGGIAGTLLGLLGAVLGGLTSLGKGKKLVMAMSVVLASLGLMILVTGVYAVAVSQPYDVFYPLLLVGGLTMVAGFVVMAVAPARYRDVELRRMQALDLT